MSLPFVVSFMGCLVPNHIITPLTLFNVASSLRLWKVCTASLQVISWVGGTDVAVI